MGLPDVSLSVTLFGTFAIRRNGQAPPSSPGGPTRELLSHLFCFPGRTLRREALLVELWEEADIGHARGALNTALWRLRKFLEPYVAIKLISTAETVALAVEDDLSIDARDLERSLTSALSQLKSGHALDGTAQRDLVHAVNGCEGNFLDGMHATWVLVERERYLNMLMRALTILLREFAERRDYAGALDIGRRILALDPFREQIQCEIMWLYVLDGQRARALRQFEDYRALLARELAIEPMPETRAICEFIVQGMSAPEPQRTGNYSVNPIELLFRAIDESRRSVLHAIRSMTV